MCMLRTRFSHVRRRFVMLSRWLVTKISALELRRKFIKSALLVGFIHCHPPPPPPLTHKTWVKNLPEKKRKSSREEEEEGERKKGRNIISQWAGTKRESENLLTACWRRKLIQVFFWSCFVMHEKKNLVLSVSSRQAGIHQSWEREEHLLFHPILLWGKKWRWSNKEAISLRLFSLFFFSTWPRGGNEQLNHVPPSFLVLPRGIPSHKKNVLYKPGQSDLNRVNFLSTCWKKDESNSDGKLSTFTDALKYGKLLFFLLLTIQVQLYLYHVWGWGPNQQRTLNKSPPDLRCGKFLLLSADWACKVGAKRAKNVRATCTSSNWASNLHATVAGWAGSVGSPVPGQRNTPDRRPPTPSTPPPSSLSPPNLWTRLPNPKRESIYKKNLFFFQGYWVRKNLVLSIMLR